MWTLLMVVILLMVLLFFWPFGSGGQAGVSTKGAWQLPKSNLRSGRTAPGNPTATLVERFWLARSLYVTTAQGDFVVEYRPWGLLCESVLVNGKLAARRRGMGKMSHRYEFAIGRSKAQLTVLTKRWWEPFPPCSFRFFALELDGQRVYAEPEQIRRSNHFLKCPGCGAEFRLTWKRYFGLSARCPCPSCNTDHRLALTPKYILYSLIPAGLISTLLVFLFVALTNGHWISVVYAVVPSVAITLPWDKYCEERFRTLQPSDATRKNRQGELR